MSERILEKSTKKAYEDDMVKYSIIVNRRRAFPETRDSLKIGQRRTLFDLYKQGATAVHRIKVAAVTGDTTKLFHPHGTSSVYTCLVSLQNWYKCKVPLIIGQGNWGTIMGDGAAAERYIEAGLSDFALECVIGEIKDSKGIVDWVDNYTRTTQEPEYLPVKVPLLLINGSFGIGVGMAVNIPPHNLVEVLSETRKVLKNPNHQVFLIPDHCQPCHLINTNWKEICNTGRGTYKVRGHIDITEEKGYPTIHIRSIPDNIYSDNITDKLEAMVLDKQLPMVKDINDQSISSKKIVDIVVTLKKGADPNYVKEVIYAKTAVQSSVSVNFEAVDGVDPVRYNYSSYIRAFLDMRMMTKFRLYCNKLSDNMTRTHQLIAYIKIIESGEIDNIIKMIKKQVTINEDELIEFLIKKIGVTDLQAKFILATDIKRLSKGYLQKYKDELATLEKDQVLLRAAITDDGTIIRNDIDKELSDIMKKYGSPRLCDVIDGNDQNIPKGIFKLVVTERNYIRKIPDNDKVGIVKKDNPKFILRVDNTENVLLFDNKGKVFKLPVSKVPVTDRNSAGIDIRLLSKNLTADIISVFYEPMIKNIAESSRKHYFTVVTKENVIKKMDMEDFLSVNLSGLMYTKLKDTDEVVGIVLAPSDLDIVIYSNQKALRTPLKQIPLVKRNASGSKAMNTTSPIEGISVIYPNDDYVVVITENGRMNKFQITGLGQHDRAKAGNNVIKLDANDNIKSIFSVSDKNKIRVVTSEGPIEVPVESIKCKSAIAAGDKVINTKSCNIIRCDVIS